jgi:ketosteroid isomerase-like protein
LVASAEAFSPPASVNVSMKANSLLLFFVSTPLIAFAQEQTGAYAKQTLAVMSARDRNVRVILEIFRALEQRDPNRGNVDEREEALYQPDVEFHWPRALPYGGTFRGKDAAIWSATWNPLQPTAVERKMDPRVIGADEHQVVILYRQRGVSRSGERFDGEVIGLYELRDFKLSRAQMFYFDEEALAQFLQRAAHELR